MQRRGFDKLSPNGFGSVLSFVPNQDKPRVGACTYISGEGGSLWVGRDATWKQVYQGGSSILWNDVLWFQDRLWLASDYQFRVWNGKSLEPVMHQGEEVHISGHMDARDGLLAIASQEVVMCFDGQDWRTIVAPYL